MDDKSGSLRKTEFLSMINGFLALKKTRVMLVQGKFIRPTSLNSTKISSDWVWRYEIMKGCKIIYPNNLILAWWKAVGGHNNRNGQPKCSKISSHHDCSYFRGSIIDHLIHDNHTCAKKPNVSIFHYFVSQCYNWKRSCTKQYGW